MKILIYCLKLFYHMLKLIYPHCKGTKKRTLDKSSKLKTCLKTCHHSLHLGIMSFMLDLRKDSVHWIFVKWKKVLETLFHRLNLKQSQGYLLKMMPHIFVKTRHKTTDTVTDWLECFVVFYEFNLIFFNYKNPVFVKALIRMSPMEQDFC